MTEQQEKHLVCSIDICLHSEVDEEREWYWTTFPPGGVWKPHQGKSIGLDRGTGFGVNIFDRAQSQSPFTAQIKLEPTILGQPPALTDRATPIRVSRQFGQEELCTGCNVGGTQAKLLPNYPKLTGKGDYKVIVHIRIGSFQYRVDPEMIVGPEGLDKKDTVRKT